MTVDQAIATLQEFRMLRLGPELSAAIDVVVAELERNPFRAVSTPAVPVAPSLWDGSLMYFGGRKIAPKHNMADAA